MSSTVSGVHWKANYGEISDDPRFRIGKVESNTWEATFPLSQLADLVNVLQGVTPLAVGVIEKGVELQARKVDAGFFTDVIVEPRLDTGVPAQIMRLSTNSLSDLIYAIELLAQDIINRYPDDWDFGDAPIAMAFDKYGRVTSPITEAYFENAFVRYIPEGTKGDPGPAGPPGPPGGAVDATTTTKGSVQLAGDLSGTASAPTVPGLAGKAPLASPSFTGTPTAPTQAAGNNSTRLATTAFVSAALSALVDAAPGTLDTLNELAAALGDDPNFAATVTTALAGKVPVSLVDAKGDLIVGTGNDAVSRVAVGSNGQHLEADSTAPGGVKWAISAAGGGGLVFVL